MDAADDEDARLSRRPRLDNVNRTAIDGVADHGRAVHRVARPCDDG
jgi:hypothetical protein